MSQELIDDIARDRIVQEMDEGVYIKHWIQWYKKRSKIDPKGYALIAMNAIDEAIEIYKESKGLDYEQKM
jgi:retron-type reverse transcriptase